MINDTEHLPASNEHEQNSSQLLTETNKAPKTATNTKKSSSQLAIAKRKRAMLVANTDDNWNPDADGEDQESCSNLVTEMKEIMLQAEHERDIRKLKEMMKRTYSFRRTMINKPSSISEVSKIYPALLTKEGMVDDFELLCNKSKVLGYARSNLEAIAPALINIARKNIKRRLKSTDQLTELMCDHDNALNETDASEVNKVPQIIKITALRILPILLGDACDLFYKQYPVSH